MDKDKQIAIYRAQLAKLAQEAAEFSRRLMELSHGDLGVNASAGSITRVDIRTGAKFDSPLDPTKWDLGDK